MAKQRFLADFQIIEIDHQASSTSGATLPSLGRFIARLGGEGKWQNETHLARGTTGFI
jgi:hypothetical protein